MCDLGSYPTHHTEWARHLTYFLQVFNVVLKLKLNGVSSRHPISLTVDKAVPIPVSMNRQFGAPISRASECWMIPYIRGHCRSWPRFKGLSVIVYQVRSSHAALPWKHPLHNLPLVRRFEPWHSAVDEGLRLHSHLDRPELASHRIKRKSHTCRACSSIASSKPLRAATTYSQPSSGTTAQAQTPPTTDRCPWWDSQVL